MYKLFNSVTEIEIIESDNKKIQQISPKQIQTQNETMTNGNAKIAITGIIAAAVTILGIVALLADANTKLKLDGEYRDDSVKIELEKTQLPDKKQSESLLKEADDRFNSKVK